MSNINPYASPQTPTFAPMPMQGTGPGMWRQGHLLVVPWGLVLPERCPVTNEPAKTRYPYEFIYLSTEASVGIYVAFGWIGRAIAEAMADKARYDIPLSDTYISSYRTNLAIGIGALVGGILMIVGAAFAMGGRLESLGGTLLVLALVAIIGGLIWLVATQRNLVPHHVSQHHVWINGACEEYLAGLPQWPFEPK